MLWCKQHSSTATGCCNGINAVFWNDMCWGSKKLNVIVVFHDCMVYMFIKGAHRHIEIAFKEKHWLNGCCEVGVGANRSVLLEGQKKNQDRLVKCITYMKNVLVVQIHPSREASVRAQGLEAFAFWWNLQCWYPCLSVSSCGLEKK